MEGPTSQVLIVHAELDAREAQLILKEPAEVVLFAKLDQQDGASEYCPGADPSSHALRGHLAKEATSVAVGV